MSDTIVPLIIRGKIIEDDLVDHGGRRSGTSFRSPQVANYVHQLPLPSASDLAELYELSFDDLLDYLEELGPRLALDQNPYLAEAFAMSLQTSGLSPDILRHLYSGLPARFDRKVIREIAENAIGIPFLEGWVERELDHQHGGVGVAIRAFGARTVHVVAGNTPAVSAGTIINTVITRSDAIIKVPSNDPLTAAAIVRTMIEMAPEHPITRHLSVAYWKGGDVSVEQRLYSPKNIEKIVAWGGQASIEHIARYIQPGIDLITLDPKLSSTIIGREAFATPQEISKVARLIALDAGGLNQEACLNARVVYVESGTDEEGLENLKQLGEAVAREISNLPSYISDTPPSLDADLAENVEALRLASGEHAVFGTSEGGVAIVSLESEPVDFSRELTNRVVNLVPVDDLEMPVEAVTAYTQTIGVFPEELKTRLRSRLALHGAQRIVTLGSATRMVTAGPHDGLEFLRRLCKWVICEDHDVTKILASISNATREKSEALVVE